MVREVTLNAQQESIALQHYDPHGSANTDWIRMAREIEAAEDFSEYRPEIAAAYAAATLILIMIGCSVMVLLSVFGVIR
jgi:hypothetical protein